MFKGSSNTYQLHFLRQVENFIHLYSKVPLAKLQSPIAIGVSAGSDSVALLLFCVASKKKYPGLNFTVLHFNHQSRPAENLTEEHFVRSLCLIHGLPIVVGHSTSNTHTELAWRKARQEFFQQALNRLKATFLLEPILWLAHHIDDSWEWSQMQQAKSGHLKGHLGIPVRHGAIFRPFLSVTKKHILSYLKYSQQNFIEDSSNHHQIHERNWWRHNVLNMMKKKYPQVLKHYVHRSMDLALELNLIYQQTPKATLHILDAHTHRFSLNDDQKIEHSQHLIKNSLHTLSKFNRMKIRQQLKSLFQSYQHKKKGPIYFSGGVKAYLQKNYVILTNKENLNNDILNEQ